METVLYDLVLDVGNTRMKAALYGPRGVERSVILAHGDLSGLRNWLAGSRLEDIALASVILPDPQLEGFLSTLAPVLVLHGGSPSPLISAYGTPHTLGVDRLANAVGARQQFPGRPVIAIDLGTCITYDVVDGSGRYHGGLITPGMTMRARAMNAYSARLPRVEPSGHPPLVGRDTVGSLEAGIHHGVRAELVTLIHELRHEMPDAAVVLTGGDALRFTRALKNGIFADPSLTLNGTHALLLHHRSLAAGHPSGDGRAPGTGADRG
jgi:type III pantothenate kinase